MAKNLVIVESPHKTIPIGNYLGKDYKVVASVGHIRDLSTKGKYGFGVDIENNFKPDYVVIKGKKKVIDNLKKEVKDAKHVYLATDPDREGEAISWHLYDALKLNDADYDRVVFNEITKNAVKEAFNNTRKIDYNLVDSQKTRSILDKIIGFRLSRVIKAKTSGISAGHVQSVALKLVVEKEREIQNFKSEEYWTITANFNDFSAELYNYNHKDLEIHNELEATEILKKLSNAFNIESVDKKEKAKKSKPVYTTSTMQQDASNKLNMSSKKTMSVAQKLYEGINVKDEVVGLITYMRTDSVRVSKDFVKSAYDFIKINYGEEYVGSVKVSKKSENVQDAHEGIRPTDINKTPESIKAYLTNDEYKLYRLIYYRALASLMKDAKTINTTVILDNNNYQFKATGQIIKFDGYLKVYSSFEDTNETTLPPFDTYKSKVIVSNEITKEQHFTKPPARYTEAKLIKEMEELGIGRPSTYAQTMSVIKDRGYVTLEDKKFVPTELGFEVSDKLEEAFSNIINVEYTASMENDLDKIAEGKAVWYKVLDDFYKDFEPTVEDALKKLPKKEAQKTGEVCPNCGSDLVIRKGRFGEFTACSNYPKCKYIKTEEPEEIAKCPNCGGKIIEKKSKRGKVFYGCNNYPTCQTAYWDKPINELCPNCNAMLTEKNGKVKCSSCDYVK